ncbi:MAG: maltotransferase domain-containing protein, partial [Puniceicoccales bacterium]
MTPTDPLASGANRVIIENIEPSCDHGLFPVKSIIGEPVDVSAHIFTDGHDRIRAVLQYRLIGSESWTELPLEPLPNDEWRARFYPEEIGIHEFTVAAWVDHFFSWQNGFRKKVESAQALNVELQTGIELIEDLQNRATSGSRDTLVEMASLLREPSVPMGEKIHLLLGEELTDLARTFPDR